MMAPAAGEDGVAFQRQKGREAAAHDHPEEGRSFICMRAAPVSKAAEFCLPTELISGFDLADRRPVEQVGHRYIVSRRSKVVRQLII